MQHVVLAGTDSEVELRELAELVEKIEENNMTKEEMIEAQDRYGKLKAELIDNLRQFGEKAKREKQEIEDSLKFKGTFQ